MGDLFDQLVGGYRVRTGLAARASPERNLKTAKTLGLDVPDKLLALADGVIE